MTVSPTLHSEEDSGVASVASDRPQTEVDVAANLQPATPTTCIEHQAGRPTLRLSFQIKVF